MLKSLLTVSLLLLFTACNENKPVNKFDGKKLIEKKCSSCHNLDMPPVTSDDEKAPPIMAVSFHVHDFVKPAVESQRTAKAIEFVVDYVLNPSAEKSFCDKQSLKTYGVMPSQKGKVSQDELEAIAIYIFEHYTPQNFLRIQKERAEFDALAPGKKLAIRYKCLGCHRINKKIVGPSFIDISKKYANSKDNILQSIKNGSKNRWKSSNGAIMPSFKHISDKDLNILTEWILEKTIKRYN